MKSFSFMLMGWIVLFGLCCQQGPVSTSKWIKSDTVFSSLPEALEAPERAKVLIIRNVMPSGKQISNPKRIDERIKQLTELHTLLIYGVAQTSIPTEVTALKKLTTLQLHGYGLVESELEIPEDLSSLQNLQMLTITQCQLKKLPMLPHSLRQINFSSNELTHVDGSLLSANLEVIDFSENQIPSFPTSGNLQHLRKLYLHQNKLTNLEFLNPSFKVLEFISVSQNPINGLFSADPPPSLLRLEAIGLEYTHIKGLISDNTQHVWLTEPTTNEEKIAIEKAHPGASVNWFYRAR